MAFPTIPTAAANTLLSSATTTASTTHTFPSLTTLAPAAGDLIIAIIVQYQGGAANAEFSGWPTGFTEILDDSNATSLNLAVGVAYKIAAGGETGTFNITSAHSFMSSQFLMRIPAATWHGTTAPAVLAAVRATGAVADPGALTPSWGANDTLWISVCGQSETSTTGSPPVITAAPTNYSGALIVARNADAVGNITAGTAFRQLNASSEDVGPWTETNATHGNGLATVIAVRPVPTRQIVPAAINATSAVTATVTDVPAPPPQGGVLYAVPVQSDQFPNLSRLYQPAAVVASGATKQIAPDTGISATSSVTASVHRLAAVTPAAINATSNVTAAVVRLRPITPAAVNATSSVTATVKRLAAITPAAINATSSITASIGRLRPIVPASISATSNVTASVSTGATRQIAPAAINATSTVTASVSVIAHIPSVISGVAQDYEVLWASRIFSVAPPPPGTRQIVPTSINASSDITATVSDVGLTPMGGVLHAVPTVRPELTPNLSRLYGQPTVGSTTKAIVPAGINATSTLTAAVVRIRQVSPTLSSTSTVTASVVRIRPIGAAISSTSAVTATVNRLAVISGASISSTSTVTASVTIGPHIRQIVPAQINATSNVTANVLRLRAPTISAVASTSTVSASVVALRSISPSIASTSFMLTVVVSGSSVVSNSSVTNHELWGNTVSIYTTVSNATDGLRRRWSREPIQENLAVDSVPPVAMTQNFVYILWDNSKREIVSRHGSQAEADAALRRRLARSDQDLTTSTIDV
jgi:hypothetical protein